MKKMLKYLEKIGVEYRVEKYGNNYFNNVPAFTYDAAIVSFDYSNDVNSFHVLQEKEKTLFKYCDRYGYIYHSFGHFPGCFWWTICRRDDFEKSALIGQFEKVAQEKCEQVMHDFHERNLNIDLNEVLRSIMDTYGNQYNMLISKITKIA